MRTRKTCNVIAILLIGCLISEAFSQSPGKAEILDGARQQIEKLKTVAFAMKVSAYPDSPPLRFWAGGAKTRFECSLPTGPDRRVIPGHKTVYAFDGSYYREMDNLAPYLSTWGTPQSAMFGPCWTPIEESYRWLQIGTKDGGFCWRTMNNPANWAGLDAVGDVIRDDRDRRELYRIEFRSHRNTVTMKVWFDPDFDYYPVAWDMISRKGGLAERCQVLELASRRVGGHKVWFPVKVQHSRFAIHPNSRASSIEYCVDRESLQINKPIDDELFTLSLDDELPQAPR